jgi:peptidoglycan/LPS O-acetylase OafA/YrhL
MNVTLQHHLTGSAAAMLASESLMAASPLVEVACLETFRLPEGRSNREIVTLDSRKQVKELDGLRGIAILLVLLCHSTFELHPSSKALAYLTSVGRLTWSGVDLFFVLSGFLIGGILLDARNSPRYYSTFYIRRAFRILPAYAVLVCVFLIRFLRPDAGALGAFSANQIPWFAYFTFSQNLWMAGLGSFGVGTMAATWSLAIEEQFYLTAPWVVRRITKRRLAITLVGLIAVAPLVRVVLYCFVSTGSFADYVLMPCRADTLGVGVLIALLVRQPKTFGFLLAKRSALKKIALLLLMALAIMTPWGLAFSGLMVTGGYSCLACFYGSLLLIAVTGASPVITRLLRNKGLMKLGTLAYFTYLFHLPLMEAARRLLVHELGYSSGLIRFLGGWLGIGVTLVCAALSWRFFESPLLRKAHCYKY